MRKSVTIFIVGIFVTVFSSVNAFSAFVIDNFQEGGFDLDLFTPTTMLQTTIGGLSPQNTIGGERYARVTRLSGTRVRGEGLTGPGLMAYVASGNALGTMYLEYGRNAPLNVNVDREIVTGLYMSFIGVDTSAQGGADVSLTLHSGAGSATITRSFLTSDEFVLQWEKEEFSGAGVDLTNVTRIEVLFHNFANPGADFFMTFFGFSNGMPEPSTMALLVMAIGFMMIVRNRVVPQPVPVAVRAGKNPQFGLSSADLYNMPTR